MTWPTLTSTNNGDPGAMIQSLAQAQGLIVSGLSQLAQLQLVVANILNGGFPSGTATQSGSLTVTGAITATTSIKSSGATAGLGYATGAGGVVTQASNRTTAVQLDTICGQITTNTASLGAETAAEFTVTCAAAAIGDVVAVSIQSGSNGGNTDIVVSTVAAGSFKLKVANNNAAGGTAETGAIVINYAILKAVAS